MKSQADLGDSRPRVNMDNIFLALEKLANMRVHTVSPQKITELQDEVEMVPESCNFTEDRVDHVYEDPERHDKVGVFGPHQVCQN